MVRVFSTQISKKIEITPGQGGQGYLNLFFYFFANVRSLLHQYSIKGGQGGQGYFY